MQLCSDFAFLIKWYIFFIKVVSSCYIVFKFIYWIFMLSLKF